MQMVEEHTVSMTTGTVVRAWGGWVIVAPDIGAGRRDVAFVFRWCVDTLFADRLVRWRECRSERDEREDSEFQRLHGEFGNIRSGNVWCYGCRMTLRDLQRRLNSGQCSRREFVRVL